MKQPMITRFANSGLEELFTPARYSEAPRHAIVTVLLDTGFKDLMLGFHESPVSLSNPIRGRI